MGREIGKRGAYRNEGDSSSDWKRGYWRGELTDWEKTRSYRPTGRGKSSEQGKRVENACRSAGNGVDTGEPL